MVEQPTNTRTEITRPQRWDVPFGPDMTEEDVERILPLPPFARIDASRFPSSAPLRGIIRNDTRIVRYSPGDIVVRQGDYGNSAFLVLSGAVRVVLDPLPASLLGRRKSARKGLLGALAQLWRNPNVPESRDLRVPLAEARLGAREARGPAARVFLSDVQSVLREHKTVGRGPGSIIGELAAIGRTPRAATVFADEEAELLEIRWQGLRDIRRRSDEIREHIDQLYRERALQVELSETRLFRHLGDRELQEVADETLFETYGSAEWSASFKKLSSDGAAVRFAEEPIIAEEGHYLRGLFLVRSGFVRVSRRVGAGEQTVGYLRQGDIYGLEELSRSLQGDGPGLWQHTLRALGYVDVLVIQPTVAEKYVTAALRDVRLSARRQSDRADPWGFTGPIDTPLLEFLGEKRYINGTATMVIDLERCARCDDCVCACAATHGNNPRFIRHGPRFGRHMIANACMHCVDPVCMIGCPTGAIHRSEEGGEVVINDATCIGCATCAESCPYHNIRMVEIRDRRGQRVFDRESHLPVLVSTKCDLCVDQPGGPACRRACPHDAVERVDMRNLTAFAAWMQR